MVCSRPLLPKHAYVDIFGNTNFATCKFEVTKHGLLVDAKFGRTRAIVQSVFIRVHVRVHLTNASREHTCHFFIEQL